jgi:hypothetical protein
VLGNAIAPLTPTAQSQPPSTTETPSPNQITAPNPPNTGGQEVVINIGYHETEPSVREIKGMPSKDKKALAIVLLNQEELLDYWEEIANA